VRLLLSALCTVALTVTMAPAAEAREAPISATVLIRVRGTIRVEAGRFPGGPPEVTDLPDVEIGTGTGFVVSAGGYIVTNHHVVSDDTFDVERQGQKARVSLDVQSIEVVFPPAGGRSQRFAATLVGSDETVDLAVLFVSASELPSAALGDSDAVASGDAVRALGYPLGDLLEVARSGRDGSAPDVTSSPGAVSALRMDDRDELAYLQTTATLNPGNSGGPLVDQDGYVVGVVRMQVRGATGIGFAIPINRVKRFLASRGLDHHLPARTLTLGGPYVSREKGLSVRLPYGFQDESQTRLRVEAPFDGITLRIDRVASAWRLEQIEQVLLTERLFEPLSWTRQAGRGPSKPIGRSAGGSARAAQGSAELAMEYALAELSGERLMARYVGPADAIAFNRGTLRASLASLEGVPLVAPDAGAGLAITWATAVNAMAPLPALPLPSGWVVEPGVTSSCSGLPAVERGVTASPPHDFTITLRAGWMLETALDAATAAARCAPRRPDAAAASYTGSTDWLGTPYTIEGVFVERNRRLLHLQAVAPEGKASAARAVLDAWVDQLGR
jgi:S1-C subfamily serine protease